MAAALVAVLGLAACGSDNSLSAPPTEAPTTAAATTTSAAGGGGTTTTTDPGISASGISKERCDKNKAAGPITYLTSFDFAAAASILDVVVA
jgi:NitT/TauT family transport system substrate-binding protein